MSYGDVVRGRFSPVRPLLAGDIFADDEVAGFAWQADDGEGPSTHLDDKLLVDGDQHLANPPNRVVPQTSEGAVERAPMPPDDLRDLDGNRVRNAASVDPTLPLRVEALLDLPAAPWQPVARTLFASVHATGHRIWLAGGVVRDAVLGLAERRVNDLDLSGTIPPGRFSDIAYQSLRATRMSEFRTTVTPGTLVCAVTYPGTEKDRLIEYRGLAVGGFQFPAVGSTLIEDVRHRDFRFNSMFYDVLEHELFDPTGGGINDLLGDTRRFFPLKETDDAGALGEIVIRALKFALRWAGSVELDLAELNAWLSRHGPDLHGKLTPTQWARLERCYAKSIDADTADQREFAKKLVQPGCELLEKLIGGAR
jgi:hypothetical protein